MEKLIQKPTHSWELKPEEAIALQTKLVGDYEEPPSNRGGISYLTDGSETIGAVVRTRSGVKPVFVSSGHLMDLSDSIRVVIKSCRGYRLPEPIRRADHLSRKMK